MQVFVIFLIAGICKGSISYDVEKRWCSRNETTNQKIVTQERIDREVGCLDLYRFIQDGWKYDEKKMREFHGDQESIESYFQHEPVKALCRVYLPKKVKKINVTNVIMECCPGWTGLYCQKKMEHLGRCYYNNMCQNTPAPFSSAQFISTHNQGSFQNRNDISVRACCLLLKGVTWKKSTISENEKATDHSCIQCDDMTKKTVKHFEARKRTVCAAWNENYLFTLESTPKIIPTGCAYRMIEAADATWWIDIENDACNDTGPCGKKLRINFGEDAVITMIGDKIFVNQRKLSDKAKVLPKGIVLKQMDGFVIVESSVGVSLKWNKNSVVIVTLDENIDVSNTKGVCRMQEANDVFEPWISEGIYPPHSTTNQHLEHLRTNYCHNRVTDDVCNDISGRFNQACRFILEDKLFEKCRKILSPHPFYKSCIQSSCRYGTNLDDIKSNQSSVFLCESAIAYMMICVAHGIKLTHWMEKYNCSWQCPAGLIFVECATKCPLSCEFPNEDQSSYCMDDCVPGCQCPKGEVLKYGGVNEPESIMNGDNCVQPGECPCKHRNSFYKFGEKMTLDCNECVCGERGAWKCSSNHCQGICHVISATHVITFDNSKIFIEKSPCPRNILMKTLQPVFRFIEVEMELKSFEQDGNSELQSIRNLKVTIGKDAIKLKKSMMKIELNGLEAALPFRNKLFTVRHASTHTFFVQSFGFLLIWIPTSDMIRLVLDPIYSDKIIGICGTYNWNPKDDQMTPDGDIELLSSIFVRKFQQNESGEDCFSSQSLYLLNGDQGSTFADAAASSHPCATHTQRRHHAQQTCNLLLKIDFQPCSFFVDPQFYEAACLHDLCSSTDFTKKPACRTLSAYAFSCLQFANDSSIISKLLLWRQNKELNGECDLYCPPNLHFSECLPLASTMCSDLNRPLPSYHNVTLSRGTDHKVRCFPGCACLKGKRLTETRSLEFTETSVSSQLMTAGTKRFDVFGNTLTCVNEMHCPCYNGGNVFAAKSQIKTGCISCECSSGRWNCSSKACGATVRCPNNMIFSRNVTPCDQKTCDNANHVALLQDKGECENEFSFESCICPNGLLQQGEECISAEECPCRHGGKMFYKGERMSRDCNTCTCKRSLWHCTNTLCSGVCVVTGDSHYITFDGQKYSFQGSCTYILVRERNALFQVSAENVPCGLTGVTCTKSVYINVGATFVHLLRGKRVTVNGAKVGRLPRHYGSHFTTDDVNVLSIDLAGIYVVVSWPKIGLFVFWDGGTRVQIQLSPLHKGRVSGLCGNYDQMTTNEFATQQGSVETILFDFVNSWKTSSVCFETIAAQELPDFNPCETNLHRAVWGRRKCLIISRGRIFSECRNIVPYETYYAWCVHDACACDSGGDCECLCTAIAAYNQACNHQHVFVEWRSQDLCPMQCDNGMVYMACGPVCQETCFNSSRPDYENCEVLSNNYQVHAVIYAASFLQSHCSALSCVEGCFCPPGMVMHEQRCVTRSECPCFLENGEYSAGALLQKDCQYCTCVNGAWDCEGKPCASLLPSCGTDKFLCGDGVTCISSLWKCDFENDCIDGSDEIGCDWTTSECILMGGHVCGSGKCLLFSKKCNGETDCEDGTDEVNCTDVGYNNSYTSDCNSFSCSSGKCIPESMVCDGNLDCGFGDYSDEQRCHGNCLYLSQYSCGGGVCISRRAYCDGTPDCRNGSDEVGCVCTPTYYTCLDGLCIDRALVCDGEPDCSQGEDELDCDEFSSVSLEPSSFLDAKSSNCTEFHCNSDVDKCIPWPSVCDGLADCPDRSDESKRCWTPCIENKFSCDRGMTCVDEGLLCDGVTQCRDGSDESNLTCSESSLALISLCARGFQCDNGSCINGSLVCDELNHCLHGEDEVRCQGVPIVTAATQATLTLQAGNISCAGFTCLDGKCIELNQVCNGINECLLDESAMQSSDEEGCATWNAWKTWGDCSRTCGSGLQLRNRTCIHKPHNKEYNDSLKTTCKGKSYETQPCFRMACHNRTIGLTPWSRWSLCSVTCGGGLTTRWRLCTDGTHTCSVALYGGRYQSPLPLVEIKSCLPEVCPNKQCVGDKKFYSCNGKDRNGIKECPLTCRDVALGGVAMCVASSSGCQPGCHCPHGFVTINETSKRCLPINDCPCFYKGKMYNRGEEVTKKESCERCQCSLAGRWKGCIDDTLCDSSRLCEWTTWSNWGPCFGPCSVNGIQWSFRSPIMPTRYGSSRRCKGIYRKSRRCPTARCVTCDVTESRGSTTSRNAGEQWKQEPCHVCMCRENRTVTCQKHCDLSTVNCSNNGTLIEPKDESSCCYCQSSNFSSGPAVNSITSVPSSVEEYRIIQNTKSTTASFADGNGQFSSVGYDSNTSADVGNMNGTTKTCKMYQCSATGKCIDSKAMCNGIFDCPDKSDEDTEICRHYNVGSAKVGCFYAPWSDWSICSQSCGLGKQTRHRGVKKHTGFYTVEESCEDGFQVFQTCFIASCEQNGSWSSWQTWSQCSLTCGGGAQFRRRNCDSPPPLNGGRECFGASLETKVCNALPCTARLCSGGRIYVSKTECSELRLCAQTCEDLSDNVNCKTSCKAIYIGGCFCPNGTFLQDDRCVSEDHCRCIATHTIYNPYSTFTLNGCECSCKNGKIECSFDCAGACTWSEWSKWSPCDRTCGIRGRTHRYRSPVVLGRVNSTAVTCNGVHQGTKMCPYIPCPAMWTTWSAWSQCSSSCGIGTQSRKRQCSIDGQTVEQRLCEEFDELSRHHQYRVCKNPRSDRLCSSCPNGMSYECVKCAFTCSDVSARREICTEKCTWTCSCPDSRYTQNNSCVTLEKCSCETGDKSNLSTTKDQLPAGRSRNIDCNTCTCTMGKLICTENICPGKSTTVWEWSPWSRWSPCSHTCLDTNNLSLKLQGSKRRYRECFSKQNKLAPVQSGKNWCEDLSEQAVQCGLELCPTLSTWSSWSKWSTCDRSCGGGIQACKRICKKSQALNPGACSGPTDKVRACMLPPCDGQRCPIGSSVKYGCNNSCSNGPTCFQLSSETEGPEICNVTGNYSQEYCQCNKGLLWQGGKCIPQDKCSCYAFKRTRLAGAKFNIGECTTCTCNGGKTTCAPKMNANGNLTCDPNQPCFDETDDIVIWSTWTSCSKSCDVGVRRRFSTSTIGQIYIGAWCRHRGEQQEDCSVLSCVKNENNCTGHPDLCKGGPNEEQNGWGSWSPWGSCSTTCLEKNFTSWRHRYRTCYSVTSSSDICTGTASQSSVCDGTLIPTCDRYASWSLWSHWSECSVTCSPRLWSSEAAYKIKTRICEGGGKCTGSPVETKLCATSSILTPCLNSSAVPFDDDTCHQVVAGSRYSECGPRCTKTCSGATICSVRCNSGCFCPDGYALERNLSCVPLSQCKCYDANVKRYFNSGEVFLKTEPCQRTCRCVNGAISCEGCAIESNWCRWSHWTACSKTCGKQERFRYRPTSSSSGDSTLELSTSTDALIGVDRMKIEIAKDVCKISSTCGRGTEYATVWGAWDGWAKCDCTSPYSVRKRSCITAFNSQHHNHRNLSGCPGINVQTKPCRVDLRSCEYNCPNGLVLSPCSLNKCPISCLDLSSKVKCIETNETLNEHSDHESPSTKCFPQCTCPSGLLINPILNKEGFECVSPEECPCFFDNVTNKLSNAGFLSQPNLLKPVYMLANNKYSDRCKNCTCHSDGKLECDFAKSANCSRNVFDEQAWNGWTSWSECSSTCTGGTQWRMRTCIHEINKPCQSAGEQERLCNGDVSCSMTPWETWGSCSRSCRKGIRSRRRHCLPEKKCSGDDLKELSQCQDQLSCPPTLTQWTTWTQCSVKCGIGEKIRHRWCRNSTHDLQIHHCTATEMPKDVSKLLKTESSICFGKTCSINSTTKLLSWGLWGSWSSCNGTCGVGRQKKTRLCPSHSNSFQEDSTSTSCSGKREIMRNCELPPCPNKSRTSPCPVGTKLSNICDHCQRGSNGLARRLPKTCSEVASGLSTPCDLNVCGQICLCDEDKVMQLHGSTTASCVSANNCECIDNTGIVWPPGAAWNIIEEKRNQNCKTCSCSFGQIACHNKRCMRSDVCKWSMWGRWTPCDQTCHGTETAKRSRFRTSRTSSEESECKAGRLQVKICKQLRRCPNNCSDGDVSQKTWWKDDCVLCSCDIEGKRVCNNTCWSSWSAWTPCSATCGLDAHQHRTRKCLSQTSACDDANSSENKLCDDIVMTSCPNEEQNKESAFTCSIHSDRVVFSLDGCTSRDTEIHHCSGYCPSSVRVLSHEPYIHSTCFCCQQHLDDVLPYSTVTLYCPDQSQRVITVPNIASCSCHACDGNPRARK